MLPNIAVIGNGYWGKQLVLTFGTDLEIFSCVAQLTVS